MQDVKVPGPLRDRVFFHPLCIGTDSKRPDLYRELPEIMASLNHSSLSLLKVMAVL